MGSGRVAVVIESASASVTDSVNVRVLVSCVGDDLSTAVTVIEKFPVDVGAPLITPVLAPSDRPSGNEPPDNDHERAPTPPVDSMGSDTSIPCPIGLIDVVTIARGADEGTTDSVSEVVTVSGGLAPSVASKPKVWLPAIVGTPATDPFWGSRDSPWGSDPDDTDQVHGGMPPEQVAGDE